MSNRRRFAVAIFVLMTCGLSKGDTSTFEQEIDSMTDVEMSSADWDGVVSKVLSKGEAPGTTDEEKSYALLACIRLFSRNKKGTGAVRGLELYDDFQKKYRGINAKRDDEALLLKIELMSLRLKQFPKKIDETLESINALSKLGREESPEFNEQARQFYRAKAYLFAQELKAAEKEFEEYFTKYSVPHAAAFGSFSQVQTLLGKHAAALNTCAKAVELYGEGSDSEELRIALNRFRTVTFDKQGKYSMDDLKPLLSRLARCRLASHSLAAGIAGKLYASGESKEALKYAKLEYSLASLDKVTSPVETIADYLFEENGFRGVTALLKFQQFGAAGEDSIPGTQDDLMNPIDSIASPLSMDQIAEIEEKLKALPGNRTIYSTLKTHGAVCLLLGRYDEALAACRSAYMAANCEEAKNGLGEFAIAVKAYDGFPVRADRWLAYQSTGPAGKDGVLGSQDDIKDPLENQRYLSLPLEIERTLRKIAYTPGEDMDSIQSRTTAFLALGDCRTALEEACKGITVADDQRSMDCAIKNMAAAIKSFDGYVKRANEYLAFSYYGPEGPDGVIDTKDDMENPLIDVLAEARIALAEG